MDFLADDELTLNQDDPRFKPKSERGGFSDGALGIVSGVAMGKLFGLVKILKLVLIVQFCIYKFATRHHVVLY